jgi:hypothetical protein
MIIRLHFKVFDRNLQLRLLRTHHQIPHPIDPIFGSFAIRHSQGVRHLIKIVSRPSSSVPQLKS